MAELSDKQVGQLVRLYQLTLVLACMERTRAGRSPEDWVAQLRRIASVIDGRNDDIANIQRDMERGLAVPNRDFSHIYGPYIYALQFMERLVVAQIANAEDAGLLPTVEGDAA